MTGPRRLAHHEIVDIEGFLRDGYVAIRGSFDPGTAAACRELIWDSLAAQGIRRDEPATWPPCAELDCPEGDPFVTAGASPALSAACDELIGPGRWTPRSGVGGAAVVRFPSEEWANTGYHIEGSWENYPGGPGMVNLRSRARGLLALYLFSDIGPDDAPTRLVCGSHLGIPEFLAPYGEAGVESDLVTGLWRQSLLRRPVAHATGQAGDVYLCHPFLVHTGTWPHRGTTPRMIAQPAVHVRDGFAVDGSDPSPVAQAIMAGLTLAG
jgi:hypothetical protein